MEVETLQEFARRRRDLVERLKADYWVAEKHVLTPFEALCIADGLRRQVALLKPDWPSAEEREQDLRFHQELAEKLGAARTTPGR